jgi:hypothetical protein
MRERWDSANGWRRYARALRRKVTKTAFSPEQVYWMLRLADSSDEMARKIDADPDAMAAFYERMAVAYGDPESLAAFYDRMAVADGDPAPAA